MEECLPRKLVAILYADVVAYGRLTGEDGEVTHRMLRKHLGLIASSIQEYSGRVVHYAGDAVLADFGTGVDTLRWRGPSPGLYSVTVQFAALVTIVFDATERRFLPGEVCLMSMAKNYETSGHARGGQLDPTAGGAAIEWPESANVVVARA